MIEDRVVSSERMYRPPGRFTLGIRTRPERALLFTSGLMALDPNGSVVAPGDLEAQRRHIYGKFAQLLAQLGATTADVIAVGHYLRDLSYETTKSSAYRDFFADDPPPTSTMLEIVGLPYDVEILFEAIVEVPAEASK